MPVHESLAYRYGRAGESCHVHDNIELGCAVPRSARCMDGTENGTECVAGEQSSDGVEADYRVVRALHGIGLGVRQTGVIERGSWARFFQFVGSCLYIVSYAWLAAEWLSDVRRVAVVDE